MGLSALLEISLKGSQAVTRLGDGSVEVEVQGHLKSPFSGDIIILLAVPTRWIHAVPVNSKVTQMDTDDSERVRLSLGAVQLLYSRDGLHKE
jgi:hypothetical protein